MIPTELKQKLYTTKNRIGLVGGSIKIKEYDELEQNLSAHISPQGWNAEISVKKEFQPIKDQRQKAYARKKKITNGLETMLTDISLHEFAHWELPYNSGNGCPYDVYNHDKILEAIKNELPEDKKSHASYVTNAFEDLLINPRCHEFNQGFSGQILFWDWEGIHCKEKGQKNYTPFYEAFVKLNMHLFGDNTDKALLKRHYSNQQQINNSVKKAIQELDLPMNIKDSSVLFKKDNWAEMARIFTKNLMNLLEETPTERLSAGSNNKGADKKQEQAGNGIEQKMGTKEGKEEIAYARYSEGDKQSPNLTSYEQLDLLYKRLAKAIPVKVESMTKEQSLEICPLNYRAFNEETDLPQKIKTSTLFITDEGLQFAHPNKPLTIPYRAKIQVKSFPDFKLLYIDDSGTMAEGINGDAGNKNFIPWGDKSKYHFLLLGKYGIESYLQIQGIAQYIKHGVGLFSEDTIYETADYTNLAKLNKLALSPRFGRKTDIDAGKLIHSMQGKGNFVLTISDGLVHNWDSEKDEFEKLASENYFAHIQIGSTNKFTQDLESMGFPVFYVNSGEELSKLMVNITTATYTRFTKK